MKTLRKDKAIVFVMVLATLFALAVVAVSLTSMTVGNMKAAKNYEMGMDATMVSRTGIEYAISVLSDEIKGGLLYRGWRYYRREADEVSDPGYASTVYADDDVAIAVPIQDMQQGITPNTHYPSYRSVVGNLNVSGQVRDDNHLFTLKIFDTSSQININSQAKHLAGILDNFSKAVAKRKPYIDDFGDDGIGPLKGLGAEIVAQRPTGGYRTKQELIGITDGTDTITEEDLTYVLDALTVYPLPDELQNNPLYAHVTHESPGAKLSYAREFRSPINVNTASWPVLVALLEGIQSASSPSLIISGAEAIILTNRICVRRRNQPFINWEDFDNFLAQEKVQIFTGTATEKADKLALVKANCHPEFTPNYTQLDSPIYKLIDKADLLYYTTHFIFHPTGEFEITSRGQIFGKSNQVRSRSTHYAIAKIFGIIKYQTQFDFEANDNFNNVQDKKESPNGFTYGNNLQKDYTNLLDRASPFIGGVQPLQWNSLTGVSAIDGDVEAYQGGTANPKGSAGNYLFKVDVNGLNDPDENPLDPNKADILNDVVFGTKDSQVDGAFVPVPGFTPFVENFISEATSGGVTFKVEDFTNPLSLYYISRKDEDVSLDTPTEDANFPEMLAGSGTAPLDGSANQGTLMFWFKLDNTWDSATTMRTILFVNTAFEIYDPVADETYKMGVQREVQMQVDAPLPDKPFLRKLVIQVRFKYFCVEEDDNDKINPTSDFMPYDDVEFGRSITFDPQDVSGRGGVHTNEYYHLAIRWRNGTDMNGFTGTNGDSAIAVSGNFYDANDQVIPGTTIHFNDDGDTFTEYFFGFSPTGNIVDNTPYTPTLADSKFFPLSSISQIPPVSTSLMRDNNRFVLGCYKRTPPPIMTFDDIRVIKEVDWGSDPNYQPARYPPPAPGDPVYTIYDVKAILPAEGLEVIQVRPDVRRFPNDGNPITPSAFGSTWQELWQYMTGQTVVPVDFEAKMPLWAQVEVSNSIKYNDGPITVYEKRAKVILKDTGGNVVYTLENTTSPSENQVYSVTYNDGDPAAPAGATLEDRLITFFTDREGSAPPLDPENLPSGEVAIGENASGNGFVIRFQTLQNGPIFQGPILEALTIAYLQKVRFYEYQELFR